MSDTNAPSSSTISSTDDPSTSSSVTSASSSSSIPAEQIYVGGKHRVYTKTGDKGTTSLFNMERRPKSDDYFEALGHTDELNASLGVVRSFCSSMTESLLSDGRDHGELLRAIQSLDEQLTEIQSRLFDVGAHMATPQRSSNAAQKSRTSFASTHTSTLEQWIDSMEAELPALKNFILPSGNLVTAHLHIARAVCRRAERAATPLVSRGDATLEVQTYLNRLSDYLFVAARYIAMHADDTETKWIKPRLPRSPAPSDIDANAASSKSSSD